MSCIAGVWTPAGRAEGPRCELAAPGCTVLSTPKGLGLVAAPEPSFASLDLHGVSCALDARLDYLDELRAELGLARDATCAEVTVAAYARWGLGFAGHLAGDFALAIFDERRRTLILARDRFGVRTPFYGMRGDAVHFATDLRRLASVAPVDGAPDEVAVVDFLGGVPQEESRTIHRGVRRVPPASILVVRDGVATVSAYWDPARSVARDDADEQGAGEALRSALRAAVRSRLPAAGGAGVLLSGGLDSTAVACIAAGEVHPVWAFSAVFSGHPECDERRYHRAVVEHLDAMGVEVDLDRRTADTTVKSLQSLFAEPFNAGGHWLAEPLLRAASERGVTTVLTGVDGDRVVSHGDGWRAELGRNQPLRLLRETVDSYRNPVSVARAWVGAVAAAWAPGDLVARWDARRSRRRWEASAEAGVIDPGLLARTSAIDRWSAPTPRPRGARAAHIRALTRTDRAHDVETLTEVGRSVGVAVLHPFFDHRVVELCVGLPLREKRSGGVTRRALRTAIAPLAPPEVVGRRDKAVFDAPFEAWSRTLVRRAIDESDFDFGALSGFVDLRVLRARWESLPVDLIRRCVLLSAWLRGPSRRARPDGG